MKRLLSASAALLFVWTIATVGQGTVTVFEGARVIAGDGSAPIENATIVVEGARITQVGRAATVKAPAGATRVSLTGKTVIPTLVDTHTHLSQDRDALTLDLRRRAYYGVSAAMSLGQDTGDAPFQIRAQPIAGAARFFTAGRGLTAPEPGRTTAPYWVTSPADVQTYIVMGGALSPKASQGARDFLARLTASASDAVITAKGMERVKP